MPTRFLYLDLDKFYEHVIIYKNKIEIPPRTGLNSKIDKEKFASDFAEWDFGWLNIPYLIEKTEADYEFSMVNRDTM
ncbi:hypothetical protein [Neobacillus mesonae]|uniref:hypothetical protein n=1 Tax=Neobacillus mesonae TaxID=1193713 RepID=UPI00203B5265|nr:hypothetical protein [Neobacillus mesonae]MCM3571114.1 hypothetical protein [Neobacillus mesonae]